MSHNPKTYDGAARPNETPKTFAELKPPGYWSATHGYFVEVRETPNNEFIALSSDTNLDARLFSLPDRMHVLDNMDVNTRAPLPSMQLWEVEDGPVVIDAPLGEARIFTDGKWCGMDPWETVFHGRPMSFLMFERKWPGLVSADEYLRSWTSQSG